MEPLTEEQKKRMARKKAAANAFKKRRSRIKMQKLSRKRNRSNGK
jgi:hypothetical protein